MLDFVEKALNQIAIPIDMLVVRDGFRSGAVGRDHSLGAHLRNAGAKAIGVKALVAQELFERQPADQVLGLGDVARLARREDEAKRIAERVYAGVDLRAQAAARTPDRLIFAPPFAAPAAC